MNGEGLVTLGEAAEEFGVSRNKLSRWIKAGSLVTYVSGRDARERLVHRDEVAALLRPVPMVPAGSEGGESETGKVAA